jgi:hypothetical protein
MSTWSTLLRDARRARRLTVADLAHISGVPAPTIKAYEGAVRKPPRYRMLVLLDALSPDRRARNDVLVAAGYAPDGRIGASRYMTLEEATAAVHARPWPALVMSETIEMHVINDLALRLWGFDPARLLDPVRRSVLSMVAEPPLAERCMNWDEAVSGIIAVFKAHRGETESLDRPSAYLAAVLDEINRGAPALVNRFVDLWEATPPSTPDKVAWSYPIVWRVPRIGVMRFECLVTSVNEADCLDIDDWIPADAASHRNLERVRLQP